jgi:hypothetical protein
MIQAEARTVADLFLVEAEYAKARAHLIVAMERAIVEAHRPFIVATIDAALERARHDRPRPRGKRR